MKIHTILTELKGEIDSSRIIVKEQFAIFNNGQNA